MAYNSNKGKQHSGDVLYESDPTDTQIDFENDFVAIKTNGLQRFIVSGSFITSSIPLSCSVEISASAFYGDGSNLTGIGGGTMSSFSLAGDAGSAQTIENGNTVDIAGGTGISTTTTLGTDTVTINLDNTAVSADSYTYSAITVDAQGRITDASSGTPPAVSAYNSYGANRVITAGSSAGEIDAEANLTFNGTKLAAAGHISASLGVSGSSLNTEQTVINTSHVSSSLNISGAAFYANGVLLTGGGGGAVSSVSNGANNRITTFSSADALNGEENLTFDGSTLTVTGKQTTSGAISGSGGVHITGSTPVLAIGDPNDGSGPQDGMLSIRPSDTSNKTLALMQGAEADGLRIAFGVSGSGAACVGGGHFGGIFNVSGANNEMLISVKTDSLNPVFHLSGSGELYNSGSLTLKTVEPYLHLSRSVSNAHAQIGMNSSENILIQNNTLNRHIVFKCNDGGTIKEGLRLDGAVPEVVVNQGGTDFNNTLVNFRVESDNNEYMLYVSGAGDAVGINCSAPNRTLSVSGTTSVNNDTGIALQVTGAFEATETARAKMLYYTHHHFAGASNNSWLPFITVVENTNANEVHAMVAPHDGRLVKILFRVENAQNASHTLTLYKGIDGVKEMDTAGSEIVEPSTATLPNTDATTVTFTYTGSVHYNAGDIVGIKMGTFSVNTADVQATCVWEFNQLIP